MAIISGFQKSDIRKSDYSSVSPYCLLKHKKLPFNDIYLKVFLKHFEI